MADVDEIFLEARDEPLSTNEILCRLREKDLTADKEWFWREIAPRLHGEVDLPEAKGNA